MAKNRGSIIGPGGPPKPAQKPPVVQPTSRTIDLPPLSIRADFAPGTADEAAREVELTFTTGAGVERYDWSSDKSYLEVLGLDPKNIRLSRLNAGGPLLDSHSAWSVADILGAVVPGSVVLSKTEARARVRFSKREAVAGVWQDVLDGIVRSVSVGYRIYKFEESDQPGNKLPVRLATDWEPFEISMVPIPADAAAAVRGAKPADTNKCEIVPATLSTRAEPAPSIQPSQQKEKTPMDPENDTRSEFVDEIPAEPVTPPPAAPPAVPNEGDVARSNERKRCQGITAACRSARLPQSTADKLISEGVSLLDAQTRVLEELGKRDLDGSGPAARPNTITVGEDPIVHKRAGIENALLHRLSPAHFKLTDEGRGYRGMSLLDIGRSYLHARGIRTSQMSRSQLAEAMLQRAGLHTTSDFPSLLGDVANKTLRAAYEAAPQTWRTLAKMVSVTDFKPTNFLQIGDAPALLEVLEHGAFTSGTIAEGKETARLKTFGRIFGITRQALINDDLNAFADIPTAFGRKSAEIQSDLAWKVITDNALMGDGIALFHATHANLASPGTVISVAALGAARGAMRKQRGIDGATPLNLIPRYLVVPAALETTADQFVSVITPAVQTNVNPFQPGGRTPLSIIAEPRLDANSATAWYFATDSDQAPLIYYITLDGQEGPEVRQEEGFDIDGVRFRCRLDANFAAADYRAGYKNPGA